MKQVHTTKDYSLFKSIEGNRNKNLLHINRLKKSMSENYLFTVLIVNEHYKIIDGNHRFDVIQELGLPLNYIICEGYGLNEVHILNQNSKTWNADDYLTGYCNLGYEDYIKYAEFKERYKLGHNETMALLLNNTTKSLDMFYKGEFKIKNLWYAEDLIEKIFLIKPYYSGIKRRSFIFTMMALSRNKNFIFSEFLQKLKIQPASLKDCTNVENYKALIEDIYNYHRREKVNLRY
jgi:hypothetical protein